MSSFDASRTRAPALDLDSIPELARRARLREDSAGDGWVLVYPERGLFLNETAARVLGLCDGTRSVAALIGEIGREHAAEESVVARDVLEFLGELRARGLLRFDRKARPA